MKKVFFKSTLLDLVRDLNPLLGKDYDILAKLPNKKKNKNIFPGIYLFFMVMIKSLLRKEIIFPKTKECDFLFISGSQNNFKVLRPLKSVEGNNFLVGIGSDYPIPKFWGFFYSLPYFFASWNVVRKTKGKEKKIFTAYFDLVWKTSGYLKMTEKLLTEIRPKTIVVANDHTLFFRCVLRISQRLKINTIYIQHAGVSEHFPELEYDFAFLDGKDSHEKYEKKGINSSTKVFLMGSPRFDPIFKISHERRRKNDAIGLAVNIMDQFERVQNFLNDLINTKKVVIARLHPGIKGSLEKKYYDLFREKGVLVSDPRKEKVAVFLRQIDLLIANDSYIHFDAVLSGIQSVQFDFCEGPNDNYGFLKKKFIDPIIDVSSIPYYMNKEISPAQSNFIANTIGNYQDLLNGKSTTETYKEILQEKLI